MAWDEERKLGKVILEGDIENYYCGIGGDMVRDEDLDRFFGRR